MSDVDIVKDVLFSVGLQWGRRSPEDIIAALDAAGFEIVRKPRSTLSLEAERAAAMLAEPNALLHAANQAWPPSTLPLDLANDLLRRS